MWDKNFLDDREIPPMSAEMFSALVTSRLRPVSDVEIKGGKGLELKLRVRGQETAVMLDRAYERYRGNPNSVNTVVAEFIQSVLTGEERAPAESEEFTQLAANLYPLVVSAQEWMQKREAGLRLVVRPLIQDLGVALIIDEGAEIRYVELDAIPRWGIDPQAAYERANNNLENASRNARVSEIGQGVEKLLIDRTLDGFAATRILLPARLDDWAQRVEGELVLGVPQRDFLIGFSRRHPAIDALSEQVSYDARTHDHPLIPNLLIYRNRRLELL